MIASPSAASALDSLGGISRATGPRRDCDVGRLPRDGARSGVVDLENPMASRRAPPPKPERPHHTVQQKNADINALERRIKELEDFDPAKVTRRFSDDPNVHVLETAIDETLSDIFGNGSDAYERYSRATKLDQGAIEMATDWGGHYDDTADAQRYISEGKERSLTLLRQAIKRLTEEIHAERRTGAVVTLSGAAHTTPAAATVTSRKIFIVHGHDHEMKNDVARVVQLLGFEPIILHEQPNKGRTLIEKFEDHGETAGFAIVLMSADDEGRAKGSDSLAPRARQNVVLELGYFVGKAARKRVCALMRGGVEIPSDIVGVVFEQYDAAGAWKLALGRELRAAGYTVDMNRLMV
jgi:predicted nucleotide-binding protein